MHLVSVKFTLYHHHHHFHSSPWPLRCLSFWVYRWLLLGAPFPDGRLHGWSGARFKHMIIMTIVIMMMMMFTTIMVRVTMIMMMVTTIMMMVIMIMMMVIIWWSRLWYSGKMVNRRQMKKIVLNKQIITSLLRFLPRSFFRSNSILSWVSSSSLSLLKIWMLRPLCRPHWKMMAKMRMTGLCFFPPCGWNSDKVAADGDDDGIW